MLGKEIFDCQYHEFVVSCYDWKSSWNDNVVLVIIFCLIMISDLLSTISSYHHSWNTLYWCLNNNTRFQRCTTCTKLFGFGTRPKVYYKHLLQLRLLKTYPSLHDSHRIVFTDLCMQFLHPCGHSLHFIHGRSPFLSYL